MFMALGTADLYGCTYIIYIRFQRLCRYKVIAAFNYT
jgi:hypothetical protein